MGTAAVALHDRSETRNRSCTTQCSRAAWTPARGDLCKGESHFPHRTASDLHPFQRLTGAGSSWADAVKLATFADWCGWRLRAKSNSWNVESATTSSGLNRSEPGWVALREIGPRSNRRLREAAYSMAARQWHSTAVFAHGATGGSALVYAFFQTIRMALIALARGRWPAEADWRLAVAASVISREVRR